MITPLSQGLLSGKVPTPLQLPHHPELFGFSQLTHAPAEQQMTVRLVGASTPRLLTTRKDLQLFVIGFIIS